LRHDPRLVGEGYWAWKLSAAVGRRALARLTRAGLPAHLDAPFEFLLTRTLAPRHRRVVDRVEALREALAVRAGDTAVFDEHDGASRPGPARVDEPRPGRRSMAETAHVTSVPPVWGMFLHLCAEARGARTVLELGSGAGLSGCYLGSAEGCRRFVTVEGSAERARLARAHLAEVVPHAEVVVDSFQSALADILPGLEEGLDLVFIDGNKVGGGYLDLVERLAARLNPGAVLIFDDIQWTDLRADWRALSARPGFAFAISTGRFGVCLWEGGSRTPRAETLFSIAGVDLYGARRDLMAWLGRN
jgi:predicted O-methyltransferase YrrM